LDHVTGRGVSSDWDLKIQYEIQLCISSISQCANTKNFGTKERKGILDLNAPRIVFVGGVMCVKEGGGIHLGVISGVLVSDSISRGLRCVEKAAIIVLSGENKIRTVDG